VTGLLIDEDRAGRVAPERSLSGNLDLTQVIFSEPLNAAVDIEEHLQLSRERELEQLRLDVALAAAQAYLNVLRAQTLLEVQRNDVQLTRSNLELARVRFDVGATAKSDVLRWESELATSRQAVLDSMAQRELARIELNRILHRPLEESFSTGEADLSDPALLGDVKRLRPYLGDPWRGEVFRDFMTAQGLELAPELRSIDEAIAAQNRLVASRRRAFRSPSVVLSASFEEELADGGIDFMPELPSDSSWSVAVQVGLPLYAGGARAAEYTKAREQLEQLRIERVALRERIEQRVRANVRLSFSSFNSIELADESARAAAENLELVTEAYARGAVNIIQLLDAQNAAVATQEAAANAVHDFLLDYMATQRAVGSFRLLQEAGDHEAWMTELEAYYAERGVVPRMR
jgi:outer membrane protein TolC